MNLPRSQARLKFFWTWHRRFGIVAALLVLVLSVTGLALNHTESLRLDERFATAGWLLDWYGIEPPATGSTCVMGDTRISLLGDQLYLDRHALPGRFGRLAGTVAAGGFLVVAVDGEVMIITPEGDLVDRLGPESGVPPVIDGIGLGPDGSVLLRAGDEFFSSTVETLAWSRSAQVDEGTAWSVPAALPADELAALQADFLGRILPLERVLLDVHSGRIGGPIGMILMDGAAVLLLLLALSGTWLWFRRRG